MSRRNNIIGSVVNPLYYSPALWIDFSDASSLSLSGSSITQANDKSGNGRHFSNVVGTNQPQLVSAALNGRSIARFDGVNDELLLSTNGLMKNVTGATIYVVRRWAASPGSTSIMFKIASATSATRGSLQGGNVANRNAVGGRTLDADGFVRVDSTTATDTQWKVQTGVFDIANTDLYLYVQSALEGSTLSYQSATTTSNTDSAHAAIGSGNFVSRFGGDIAEILVFHEAHNAAKREDVWNYLRSRWSI